jgi:hypothetical protein
MVPILCHDGTMNLTGYVQHLQSQLAVAAEAGGEEAKALATRLTAALDAAARLTLLEALSAAADEITGELAPGSVEVRLRSGEPQFVVTVPPTDDDYREASPQTFRAPDVDEGGTARLNLRLPESLKQRVEEAATSEGISLNAWLIRAAHASLQGPTGPAKRSPSGGDHFTGWVR